MGKLVAAGAIHAGGSVSAAGDGGDNGAQTTEPGHHGFFKEQSDRSREYQTGDSQRNDEVQLAELALAVDPPGHFRLQDQCGFSVDVVQQGVSSQNGVANGADVDVPVL